MYIKVKKLREDVVLPERKSANAVGMDIRANMVSAVRIVPGETVAIPTGIALEIPVGMEGQVRPRSGLSLAGVVVANSPGTIDPDFRGEVKVILHNQGSESVLIQHGDRIGQLVFKECVTVTLMESEELAETTRATNGFGSTGIR